MPYLRHIIASVLLAVISMQALAEPQVYRRKTTAKNLRPAKLPASSNAAAVPDTIPLDTLEERGLAGAIRLSGYDKPLRSRRETFFATNTGEGTVGRLAFTISYFDTDGRLMHRASHNVDAPIPAGETRQIGLRSWDTQQAFYYERSAVPARTEQATPYRVSIAVDTVFERL